MMIRVGGNTNVQCICSVLAPRFGKSNPIFYHDAPKFGFGMENMGLDPQVFEKKHMERLSTSN